MKDGTSTPTAVKLKYRGADVFVSDGTHLIGRSASCQLVVEDARASRRHAKLVVKQGKLSIEDLGSVNGVYVNGIRIPPGPRWLVDGDRIGIAGAELEVRLGAPVSERPERSTLEAPLAAVQRELARARDPQIRDQESEPPPTPVQSFESEPPTSGAGTQRADVFELVGPIAQKAIALGRASEAENILQGHLVKLLDDYKKNRRAPDTTRDYALVHSLSLAAAMNSSKWLSYAFDLMLHGRVLLDSKLAARLLTAMSRVDVVDERRVTAYVEMLRELPKSFDTMRALHEAEELSNAASRKR